MEALPGKHSIDLQKRRAMHETQHTIKYNSLKLETWVVVIEGKYQEEKDSHKTK